MTNQTIPESSQVDGSISYSLGYDKLTGERQITVTHNTTSTKYDRLCQERILSDLKRKYGDPS